MKRFGFTLAEILITLAIVGIIAAITIPGLSRNVSQKSIGPALAKAINNLSAANMDAIRQSGQTRLSKICIGDTGAEDYTDVLKKYLDGMREEDKKDDLGGDASTFYGNDGISYTATIGLKQGGTDNKFVESGKYKGMYWRVLIDINGKKGKATPGYEQFVVYVDDYGTVILGGSATASIYGVNDHPTDAKGQANYYCTDPNNEINVYCTNTVARNSWEVIY